MEQHQKPSDYVKFLMTIQPFCKGKGVIQSDYVINTVEAYDVHAYVCAAHRDFEIVLSQGNWCAFIFKEDVYTYPMTCNEDILTELHIQSRLN